VHDPPHIEVRKELYELYKIIFASAHFQPKKKELLLTAIFGREEWTWRVIGITKDALLLIKQNNFKNTKGTQRGHIKSRRKTFTKMLDGIAPLNFEEWWSLFWESDKTVLMTKAENNRKDYIIQRHEYIDLPLENKFFAGSRFIGFKYRGKNEGTFLKELCKQHGI
jgi:hypothetical protein